MELNLSLLVLFAAFLHACWNALVKSGEDPLLTVATVSAVASFLSALLTLFFPAPPLAAWPWLAAGVVAHNGFKIFLVLAYRTGDLSRVYPLARGSAPLVVAAFAGLVAGERLSLSSLGGVALVSGGLVSLAFERTPAATPPSGEVPLHEGHPFRPLMFALLTGIFIGAYTLIDGMGVRLSESALGYSAWLFMFDGVPMVTLALLLRRGAWVRFLRRGVLPSIGAGVLSLFAYYAVLWALSRGAMAPIAALRETGVLFAVLIGWLVLREPLGIRRLGAALLVSAGVALLHVGG